MISKGSRSLLCTLCVLAVCVTASVTGHPIAANNGPVITDRMFFESLNLDYPGMEQVREDVKAGDFSAARHSYAAYLRNSDLWKKYASVNPNPNYNCSLADKYASNCLVSCGIWHQFPETIDWSINPTPLKYSEWTWQLSRHPFWSELARAYRSTGDEKYARAFVNQMTGWIRTNPHPDRADQGVGSRWRTIEAGIRMLSSWPYSFSLFLGSESFDDDSIVLMAESFYEHGSYLRKFHMSNNWLTMEMNGLFHIGCMFPEFKESGEWADYAIQKMYDDMNVQYYPDGAQVELTTHYHGISVDNIVGIYKLAKHIGYEVPEDYAMRLEKAYEYFENVVSPTGFLPPANDSGWGSASANLKVASDLFPERNDFRYLASGGREGAEPSFTSVWMPYAGWYTMRSGWDRDALYAFFDVGPFGAAHQHEDKLSFVLEAYGRRLLTEGGSYPYDTSQWRKYVLSARAHNLSRVDGRDQYRKDSRRPEVYQIKKPLKNRWVSNEYFDFGEGWYDEGFGSGRDSTVVQYRALTFIKDRYWILFDIFTPSDAAGHKYETWFHFDTSEFMKGDSLCSVRSNYGEGPELTVTKIGAKPEDLKVIVGQTDPEVQGWVPVGLKGDDYVCREVATPVFSRTCAGQCTDIYVIYPSRSNEDAGVVEVISKKPGSVQLVFADGHMDTISYKIKGNRLSVLRINGKTVK